MAIFHLSTKPISRSSGRSSTASAAYRAACKIEDKRTGLTHDYSKKSGVFFSECLILDKYNDLVEIDRSQLWNTAEKAEKRKDGRTAREIVINLPHEVSDDLRKTMVYEFAQYLISELNVAVDYSIHRPDKEGDNRNHHCHIMMTTRTAKLDNDKIVLADKTRLELSNTKLDKLKLPKTQTQITDIREKWASVANTFLQVANVDERIDHRSFAERCIEQKPTIKMGWRSMNAERKNHHTKKGDINRQIKSDNEQIDELKIEIAHLHKQLEKQSIADSLLTLDELDNFKIDRYHLTDLKTMRYLHDEIKNELESSSTTQNLSDNCCDFIERANYFTTSVKDKTQFAYKSELVDEYAQAFEQSEKLYQSFINSIDELDISQDERLTKHQSQYLTNFNETKSIVEDKQKELAQQEPVATAAENNNTARASSTFKF